MFRCFVLTPSVSSVSNTSILLINSLTILGVIVLKSACDRGRSGKPERPFFIPKGALTHHLQSRRWYPSLQSGRALFTKHPQDASPEGQTMPQRFPAVIVCAAGRRLAPCLPLRCKPLSSNGTTRHPPAKTCQRQLYRSYGRMLPRTVHFLLSRQKKQNRPLQGQKGRD